MVVGKGHKSKQKQLWKTSVKWRDVTPAHAPELLLGSDEGGFMSLEEVDGDVFFATNAGEKGEQDEGHVDKERLVLKKKKGKVSKSEQTENKVLTLVEGPKTDGTEEKSKKKKKKRKLGEAVVEIGGEKNDDLEGKSEAIGGKVKSVPQKKAKRQKALDKNVKVKDDTETAKESPGEEGIEDVFVQTTESKGTEGTEQKKKKRKQKKKKKMQDVKICTVEEKPFEDGAGENVSEVDTVENIEVDMTAWGELRLHPLLMKGLAELGFKEPSAIQKACIPVAAHQGKDLVGAAETGSGKTLAFGLPILQRLLDEREKDSRKKGEDVISGPLDRVESGLRALIIAPTRELAIQVCDHMRAAAKYTGVHIVPIVGGMAPQKQSRLLKRRPEVVVGTPGRLWELMSTGERHLLQLNFLSFFVLDEADRMVEKGHFSELQSIIDLLPKRDGASPSIAPPLSEEFLEGAEVVSEEEITEGFSEVAVEVGNEPNVPLKKRQTMVFSATLSLPENFHQKLKRGNDRRNQRKESPDSVAALIERVGMSHKAAVVDLTTKQVVAGKLEESAVECVEEEKDVVMYYVLRLHGSGRTLVFCTSIAAVRRVAALLQLLELPAFPLHAQMQQRQRLKALERYKASEDGILVATDVASRGLDIPGIRTVLHFQLPHSAEVYVHRCGRTARAGGDGCSVALISPKDRAKYSALLRALSKGQSLPKFPIDAAFLPQVRKCVQMARKLDEKLRKNSQNQAEQTWISRHADILGVDVGAVEDGKKRKRSQGEDDEEGANKKGPGTRRENMEMRNMRQELQRLLQETLKPRAFSRSYFAGMNLTPLTAQKVLQHKGPQKGKLEKQESQNKGFKQKGKPSTHIIKGGRSRFAVIGHETSEAIEALRKVVSRKA